MSGFDTVSAALGVIHLAKITISGLCQLLKDYRDAVPRLFEIAGEFDCFQWRLNVWSQTWRISSVSPENAEVYIKALWSEVGAKRIMMQLKNIDEDCRRFTRLMASLMGDRHLKEHDLQNQLFQARILDIPDEKDKVRYPYARQNLIRLRVYSSRLTPFLQAPDFPKGLTRDSRARKYRDLLRTAKKATTMRAKADFVLSKGDTLNELLKDLNNKFGKLDGDSLKTFCLSYPDVPRDASLSEIASAFHAGNKFQRALDSRDASRALYDWCMMAARLNAASSPTAAANPKGGSRSIEKLNLDIGFAARNHTQSSSSLSYHLFVLWHLQGQEQEVFFEGPMTRRSDSANSRNPWAQHRANFSPPPESVSVVDFETACSTVLQRNAECFKISNDMSSSDSSFWFQSKYPVPNAVSTGKASSTCIHSLLETIQNKSFAESFEKFPNAERIDLAYQVAECGLMLLGTSWLSGVRSTQIKRLKNHLRQQSLFILEISDGNGEGFVIENDLLSAVEPQTFMIGVLLTEIAIATPVTGLEPYTSQDGRQKLALRITRKDDQGNKQHHGMKLGAAVREVNNCMHLSYSDAVDFCLRQSGINRNPAWAQLRGLDDADVPGRNEAYRSLLKDFYEQVFVR